MPEREFKDHCERVLPEKVCREIEKIARDGGVSITKEPKTVVRPEPVIRNGRVEGGKVVVEIHF
jgi:hypothetical protein